MPTDQSESPHYETLCFDAHSDIPFNVVRERAKGRTRVIEEDFFPGMRTGGIDARILAIFVENDMLPEKGLSRALAIAAAIHEDISEVEYLHLVTTVDDLYDNYNKGHYSFVLGMEGAAPLYDEMARLEMLYQLGLRVLTMTHSRRNMLGEGSLVGGEPPTGTPGGLSEVGVRFVNRMNVLGVVIDVSHLNEPGFWDVIEVSNAPIIASHSNCRELRDIPRNLSAEQMKAISDNDGVIGINTLGNQLSADSPDIHDYIDHIARAVEIAGIDHVGLGFDFAEYMIPHLPAPDLYGDITSAMNLANDAEVSNLAPLLLEYGFSEEDLDKIYHQNFFRVLTDVWVT